MNYKPATGSDAERYITAGRLTYILCWSGCNWQNVKQLRMSNNGTLDITFKNSLKCTIVYSIKWTIFNSFTFLILHDLKFWIQPFNSILSNLGLVLVILLDWIPRLLTLFLWICSSMFYCIVTWRTYYTSIYMFSLFLNWRRYDR